MESVSSGREKKLQEIYWTARDGTSFQRWWHVSDFFKFIFGGAPVQRRFQYNAEQKLWCPLCLKWVTVDPPTRHDKKIKIWIRRTRRWFQGKRDHQIP